MHKLYGGQTHVQSFPVRERGLKRKLPAEDTSQEKVVPRAGTWIETQAVQNGRMGHTGRSPCGNVD